MLQQVLIVGSNNGLSEMLIALAQQKQCAVEYFNSNIPHAPTQLFKLLDNKKFNFIILTGEPENALNTRLMIDAVRIFKIPFSIIFTKGKFSEGWYNEHAVWSVEITNEMKDSDMLLHEAVAAEFFIPAFQEP